jgi:hypothetical protein
MSTGGRDEVSRRREEGAVRNRTSPQVAAVWDQFHEAVNMTSEELRRWLLTDASGEVAFTPDPGLDIPELGRRVVAILRKRKVDLTAEDAADMAEVVDYVSGRLADPPASRERNDNWRHSLMRVGHDPLKPG